jgi:hypothetical protein
MRKKVLSMVLALVMVVGVLPVMGVPGTVALDRSIGAVEQFLFRGFNVFSGNELRIEHLTTPMILEYGADLRGHYGVDPTFDTYTEASSGRTIEEMAIKAGLDLSISSGFKSDLFKASARKNYSASVRTAFATAYDSYFFQSRVNTKIGKAFINDMEHPNTVNTIRRQLEPNFLNELRTATNIAHLFEKYGTHVLTSYAVGGWAEFQISTFNSRESFDIGIKVAYENAASAKGFEAGMKLNTDVNVSNLTADERTFASARIVGGRGGIPNFESPNSAFAVYNTWTGTVTAETAEILTDDNLILTGIWELLPPGDGARYVELLREYNRLAQVHNMNFCKELVYRTGMVGNATQIAAENRDLYTPVQDRTVITSEEQFMAIYTNGDTLNGNYILARDLNFAGWTRPESHEPFTGTFDGNGKTIKNFNLRKTAFNRTVENVGLFSSNEGTIRNLIVKDAVIDYNSATLTSFANTWYRVGIIAGANSGRIENVRVVDSRVHVYLNNNASGTNLLRVGGIVGDNWGIITKTSFTVANKNTHKVAAYKGGANSSALDHVQTGGIAGRSDGGSISDCYTNVIVEVQSWGPTGTIGNNSRLFQNTGGIVGRNEGTATITRCFAVEGNISHSVSGYGSRENIAGTITGNLVGGTLTNCYFNTTNQSTWPVGSNQNAPGVIRVQGFTDTSMINLFRAHGWVHPTGNPHPTLPAIEETVKPAFIVEFKNKDGSGRPVFTAGSVLPPRLSDAMTAYFIPAHGIAPTSSHNITDSVRVRHKAPRLLLVPCLPGVCRKLLLTSACSTDTYYCA